MAITLPKPEQKVDPKPASVQAAAANPAIVVEYEDLLTQWVEITSEVRAAEHLLEPQPHPEPCAPRALML